MPREAALLGAAEHVVPLREIGGSSLAPRMAEVEEAMKPRSSIVDDSLTVRMDLVEAFEAAGLRRHSVRNRRRGARGLATRKAFDLVVLDRASCPTATASSSFAEIRGAATGRNPVVMLLSSEAEVANRIRGLKTGADEYVGKPYDVGYVVARARGATAAHGRRGRRRRSPTVLVIDDSPRSATALRRASRARDTQVALAETGEEGLRIAAGRRPAAIIVDGVLPGIDGANRDPPPPAGRRAASHARASSSPRRRTGAPRSRPWTPERTLSSARKRTCRSSSPGCRRSCAAPATPIDERTDRQLLGPKQSWRWTTARPTCKTVAEALRAEGYESILARSGEEALDLLAIQPADCVLLDLDDARAVGGRKPAGESRPRPGSGTCR